LAKKWRTFIALWRTFFAPNAITTSPTPTQTYPRTNAYADDFLFLVLSLA
jgi:hypothetical protein